jgi:catechol 2,3-dioxygenase-like lactoylglutathione lyase family enzyme
MFMANTIVDPEQLVDDKGSRIICPTLHHTGTITSQPEVLLAWYRNVLGQQPTLEGGPPEVPMPAVWTTNDWAHHRMGFFKMPNMEDKKFDMTSPGIQHVAWEYETLDDLLETVLRLRKLGIIEQYCVNHIITFAAYYRDPDDNLVELLTDGFGDHEKSMEVQLTSDALRANPPGVPFDPEGVYQARQDGATLEELHERTLAGEFLPAANARAHDLPEDLTGE